MENENLDYTKVIREKVMLSLSFIFCFIMMVLATFNIVYHSQYVFASLEVIFAVYSLYVYISTKKNTCRPVMVYLYLLFIAVLILLGTCLIPISDVLFLWGFFFPTIAYLLLGRGFGFQLSALVFASLSAVLSYRLLSSTEFSFQPVMINFVTCYLTIWCISHCFELSRAKTQGSLARLALTDALTATRNRLAFNNTFGRYRGDYLLLIDLDNFKEINDQHGHDVGDRALIIASDCFKQQVGEDRIFRIGGEEFCIWLTANDIRYALNAANRVKNEISKLRLDTGTETIGFTVSGGLVKHEVDFTESELLKQADKLLYQAKKLGRNRVVCEQ